MANNALKRQAIEEAETLYRQTLAINDKHIGALNNLADILAQKGCYEEAAQLIERAVKHVDAANSVVGQLVHSTQREIQQMVTAGTQNSENSCRKL